VQGKHKLHFLQLKVLFSQSHALYIGPAVLAGLKILMLSCIRGLMLNLVTASAPHSTDSGPENVISFIIMSSSQGQK
jgi:hypothetical protein